MSWKNDNYKRSCIKLYMGLKGHEKVDDVVQYMGQGVAEKLLEHSGNKTIVLGKIMEAIRANNLRVDLDQKSDELKFHLVPLVDIDTTKKQTHDEARHEDLIPNYIASKTCNTDAQPTQGMKSLKCVDIDLAPPRSDEKQGNVDKRPEVEEGTDEAIVTTDMKVTKNKKDSEDETEMDVDLYSSSEEMKPKVEAPKSNDSNHNLNHSSPNHVDVTDHENVDDSHEDEVDKGTDEAIVSADIENKTNNEMNIDLYHSSPHHNLRSHQGDSSSKTLKCDVKCFTLPMTSKAVSEDVPILRIRASFEEVMNVLPMADIGLMNGNEEYCEVIIKDDATVDQIQSTLEAFGILVNRALSHY